MRENDTFLKMHGTFAVPGVYEKDGVRYVKTAAELKDAAERWPILPITMGHWPTNEPVPPSAQIGTMKQRWSESQKKALAEYWFDKKKLPDILRSRADDGKGISVSAQFIADAKDEEDIVHGIAYHSVAALEGEDPVCPIPYCGAFVVAESKTSQRLIFTERLEDIKTAPPDIQKEEEAPPAAVPDEEPQPEEPKTETPVAQKPTEPDEPGPAPPEEVQLVPETPIPVEAPAQTQKLFDVVDDKYQFVLPIFKQQEKKE